MRDKQEVAAEALGEAFDRLHSPGYWSNLLARRFFVRLSHQLQQMGLCAGQFGPLVWLWERDGRTQAELCRCLSVDQSTMARTLTRMERDGLIRREPDPEDRRRALVHLTDKARDLEERALDVAHNVNREAFFGLSREEAELFFRLARRMIANLNNLEAEP
ncbi:DNA-binding transcriptional regulator, MarR family [Paucidesulfovibrio gracilis DSM 16080]|uniref:DNA-binding transcriptional regulator, MarR family n=1 Tax=Paucidesulfovibrio gracilis DSM 16080 TaxID=1121449 RepID=A0A1T4Y5R6_9BACT|nr:MarR family transcriptional regulator [Paucidesulfovibrio gracilis]SKA96993.1 DNA-binding transcriptional regulator, MarR family [Paucidesulfovibrio gracilis DSM 16080]